MAPAIVYIKSVAWLVGLGGLGYVLLELTKPSKDKLDSIKAKHPEYLSEEEKKKLLFMKKLKEAASDTPVYLKDQSSTKN